MKNFKLILKSFFSNNATVEGARHRPWYFAVIIFFASMILAIVPIFVQSITKHGSDLVSKTTYNMENSTLRFTETLKEKDVTLEVSYNEATQSNVLVEKGTWDNAFKEDVYSFNDAKYCYYTHKNEEGIDDFWAFWFQSKSSDFLSDFVKDIETKQKDAEKAVPSLLIMTDKQIIFYICNVQKSTVIGSIAGDYKSSTVGFKLTDLLSDIAYTNAEEYAEYRAETWENWKVFYDEIYNNNRLNTTLATTLILLGIDVVIVFFMGLMVFILTRGKNNPFRIYTFWESIKVGMWAANMPALLTCGLGFLLTNFVQVLFALLVGVRVMWLTMKTLGPNNAPTPSSNYKQVKTVDVKPTRK